VTRALLSILGEAVEVTGLVFLMMVAVDLVNTTTRGWLTAAVHPSGSRQYFVAPLVGAMPGCLGLFTNVSLYLHGLISFGALTGSMMAGSGDEAFVMLSMFPRQAMGLFAMLAVLGMVFGWLTDRLVPLLGIHPCMGCAEPAVHATHEGFRHYLTVHVWQHIIRRHLLRTFAWTLGALLVVGIGLHYGSLQSLSAHHTILVLVLAGLVGLIPESGPHLLFVTMFANGLVPFSVLLTSSVVQDGHGALPLLSYSVSDAVWIKVLNLVFGLSCGLALYTFGY
jgi:hypothetical protein